MHLQQEWLRRCLQLPQNQPFGLFVAQIDTAFIIWDVWKVVLEGPLQVTAL